MREAHDKRPSTPCLIPPRGQGLEEGVKEATERVAQLAPWVVSLAEPGQERRFGSVFAPQATLFDRYGMHARGFNLRVAAPFHCLIHLRLRRTHTPFVIHNTTDRSAVFSSLLSLPSLVKAYL